ncbi:hypothetical protein TVAG_351620 [Trichomonas vaginalis G3]|uniref:Uncharacterized protein n=1 Tax=Trichomonas vaginalis (strain ATCC PRA-98 / G3) TaxID=412133 RepID=A2DZP6_TRIV3|nr:hypothetical protein TVAGG3_0261170 [Trichomonas vaginalis G3]EAY14114.1 hypothetical protein TVAG_351620 [Trichomonas vaginalis G3]KAI5525123.1 hypothetical protein TVAGG3_0261170 [Trichomonas vaginalis G3]|eukprot:XP_001326337.1 hypothetical protein [Trichomonas vaginalis G3]
MEDTKSGAIIIAELNKLLSKMSNHRISPEMQKLIKKYTKDESVNIDDRRIMSQLGDFNYKQSEAYKKFISRFGRDFHHVTYKTLINVMEDYYKNHPDDPIYKKSDKTKPREAKKSTALAIKYFQDNYPLFEYLINDRKNFDVTMIF